ncbi:uncharacterized protein LOC143348376 [Colletes latitarsis]|uniref:uncharacterized protein LOC143348376 n=1 Tax=Colletes latitarsis TaxID=2605962 RepID=UPI0040364DAE
MQRKNFLFERSNFNGQIGGQRTPTMLFTKSEFGQVELHNVSTKFSQFNLFNKEQFDENSNDSSFFTPPVEKQSIATPKAPIKNTKQSKKINLKPRKLQYTEEELEASSYVDSGIHVSFDQSSNALFCKQTLKCNGGNATQKQIRKLRTGVDKIKIHVNDKENDRNIVGNRSENRPNTENNLTELSSIVFNQNTETLSQCNNDFTWKEKLYWLQVRRDIGLWVQCCRKKCKKWRYVEEYHDPLDVPKVWYCEMNSDKSIASCNIPEVPKSPAVESDLIENTYNAGSIVWAYIRGYPWWPGIVNDCPKTFRYYELSKHSQQPIRYYITFFNEDQLENAWIHKRNIKPFVSNKYSKLIQKTKVGGVDYKSSLDKAYKLALDALPLTILQRLQKFSYIAQYNKLYDVNNNLSDPVNEDIDVGMNTNSDDEIPPTNPTNNYPTLRSYYLKLCKN